MKGKMFLALALLYALLSRAWAQEFPIGIYFGGNQKAVDSVGTMSFTWIQAYGGFDRNDSPNYNHILKNNRNLKVAAILERNILLPSFAQRMVYQAERTNEGDNILSFIL